MAFFPWRSKPTSAEIARERLRIIVAHERVDRHAPDYLPILQEEIMAVIAKYFPIDTKQIKLNVEREGNYEALEVNIVLPDMTQIRTRR